MEWWDNGILSIKIGKDFIFEIDRNLSRLPDLGKTVELGCGTGIFTELITPETIQDAGFAIEEAKLIGNRLKAAFLIGRKG